MKKIAVFVAAVFVFFAFVPSNNAFSNEGHGMASSMQQFRINAAEVKLSVNPPAYMRGMTPVIEAALTDEASGDPVLDADLYIRIVLMQPGSMQSPGAMKSNNVAAGTSGDSGLDFGDSQPAATGTIDLSQYRKLEPTQKAGVYAASYPLPDKGEYKFTLAVKSLSGKRYAEPVLFGGDLSYQPVSRTPLYRTLVVIVIVLASGLTGIWIVLQREKFKMSVGGRTNFLDIPWIRKFLVSIWFQPFFQVISFGVFLVIIFLGLADIQAGDRNVATLLTWTIWWAAIIFTFVFVGRIWCAVCPIGAIQDWIRKIFSFNRDMPRPLRNIWLSSFLFFGLTWLDSFTKMVNRPVLTAWLMIGLFAVAAVMAVTFKGRTFCRYVCPIGGLIGLYSMFSPVELRNRCLETCRKHKVKECIKGTLHSKPCPMFQTPMTLDRNNYCNFCSECIKSCSQDNIVIRIRSFAKDLWVSSKGYMDEAFLAMSLAGTTIIVTGEMIEPWHGWMDRIGRLIPFDLLGGMSHAARENLTFSIVLAVGALIMAPLVLLLASALVKRLTGTDSPGIKAVFIQFAYMFIPIGISMHLAHNISHLFKEGPGIVPAVERAAGKYLGIGTGAPDWNVVPLMGPESIFWLQMLILVALNMVSLYAGYRIAVRYYGGKALRAFVPMALLAVAFTIVNVYILGQPMALRHTH